ncbi:MAG: hypothetical protein KJ065_26110 [Anaerolineae bacterium]|nr:hypothetical protein [Anaerolineae bacterium]
MTRRRKTNNLIGIFILLVVVIAGGAALAATGNLENPLRIFSTVGGGEGGGFRGGEGFEPPAQPDGTTFTASEPGEGFAGRGGGEGGADSIQWSQIGSVLYDVWVMLAVTALVVLIGTPLGRALKWLRQRGAPAPAT